MEFVQVEDVPLDDSSEGSGNSPPAPSPTQAESSSSLRFLPGNKGVATVDSQVMRHSVCGPLEVSLDFWKT